MNHSSHTVIVTQQKSMGAALILTFLFGPLGLFYASIIGGIVMLILTVIIGILTLGVGFFFGWFVSIIWAAIAVNGHNKRALMGAAGGIASKQSEQP